MQLKGLRLARLRVCLRGKPSIADLALVDEQSPRVVVHQREVLCSERAGGVLRLGRRGLLGRGRGDGRRGSGRRGGLEHLLDLPLHFEQLAALGGLERLPNVLSIGARDCGEELGLDALSLAVGGRPKPRDQGRNDFHAVLSAARVIQCGVGRDREDAAFARACSRGLG